MMPLRMETDALCGTPNAFSICWLIATDFRASTEGRPHFFGDKDEPFQTSVSQDCACCRHYRFTSRRCFCRSGGASFRRDAEDCLFPRADAACRDQHQCGRSAIYWLEDLRWASSPPLRP